MQEKFEQASQHGVTVVTPFWVLDCIDQGKLLPEEEYCLLAPEQDGQLSLHVETVSVTTLPAQEGILPDNQRTDATKLQVEANEPLSGNMVHVNGMFKCLRLCVYMYVTCIYPGRYIRNGG